MKLHSLSSSNKRVQRIGRGGKRGTTAGRGTKGQHSRAGRRLRPAIRDLIIRIPKHRGFRNKTKSDAAKVLNVGEISDTLKSFSKSGQLEVTRELLQAAKLVGKNYKGEIKILSDGEIAFAITLKGIGASAGAKEKIEKAGGKA